MDYRNLGKCGVKVSPICIGTMMFGGQTSEADSIRMIHQAGDLGINFIDTADMYNAGESEVVCGKAIADRRHSVVLATKGRQKMGDGPNDQGKLGVNMCITSKGICVYIYTHTYIYIHIYIYIYTYIYMYI